MANMFKKLANKLIIELNIKREVHFLLKNVFRGIFTLIGIVSGFLIGKVLIADSSFNKFIYFNDNILMKTLFIILSTIFFGLILFLVSPLISSLIIKLMDYVEEKIQKIPASDVLLGIAGAMTGLIITNLVVGLLPKDTIWIIVAIAVDIIMAVLGVKITLEKKEDIILLISSIKKINYKEKKSKGSSRSEAKVLDTSVIIDGRIFDICQTGFIEGALVIPTFVLEELRHIADSSDSLKRNRGRRGLDILNKIQNELNIEVQIYEKDFPDIAEVDSKLLKLAQVLNGKIVTNDYNLNKVAKFQGVVVLNINELANAVKPVVLPGEEMTIQIVKDGKESGQGIAYLDDGTMIVVEGGRKNIGETKEVIVTSVLQTAAGRMIFAKQKEQMEKDA
jgi:uncharacterized protein YacL